MFQFDDHNECVVTQTADLKFLLRYTVDTNKRCNMIMTLCDFITFFLSKYNRDAYCNDNNVDIVLYHINNVINRCTNAINTILLSVTDEIENGTDSNINHVEFPTIMMLKSWLYSTKDDNLQDLSRLHKLYIIIAEYPNKSFPGSIKAISITCEKTEDCIDLIKMTLDALKEVQHNPKILIPLYTSDVDNFTVLTHPVLEFLSKM